MSPKTRIATGKLPFTDGNIQFPFRPSNSKMPDFSLKARFAERCCRKVTNPVDGIRRSSARPAVRGVNRLT
jgi:hypothetical protein